MSCIRSCTCGGGPGIPGGTTLSCMKNDPPVSSPVALMADSEGPIVIRSPSPGRRTTAHMGRNV